MRKRQKIINFAKSPAGRRLIVWLAPLLISFISNMFKGKKSKRKR